MSGPPRLTHAVVTLPALDVRPEPRHAAELMSQLLLGGKPEVDLAPFAVNRG